METVFKEPRRRAIGGGIKERREREKETEKTGKEDKKNYHVFLLK